MKKTLLLFAIIMLSLTASAANKGIMIDGVETRVDTLVHKVVGPGNTYLQLALPQMPISAYIMIIDTHNKYNRIETYLANDNIEGTELVTGACHRKTYEGHDAYCGVNGDFFNVIGHHEFPLGAPRGGSIENGEIQIEPNNANWAFATVDENGVPFMDYMSFVGTATAANGESFRFDDVNNPRHTCNLTFFNRFSGPTTRCDVNTNLNEGAEKTEVYIKPVEGQKWGVNRDIKCVVTKKVTNLGVNPIAADESVLSGIKDAKTFLDKMNDGDIITVKMAITTATTNLTPNIREMVGGNAMILQDGDWHNVHNTDDPYNNRPYPRTAIGCSKDKRYIYMLVSDGKNGFRGATTSEVAQILKHYGASDVVGLDGGGSAEMIVNKKVVNFPADGKERPVGNGWLVVNTAPTDSTITGIRFNFQRYTIPAFGIIKPYVLGYNQYDKLLDENVEGVTFSCDPQLGSVDENGVFTACNTKAYGKIKATYNGITTEAEVYIEPFDTCDIDRNFVVIDNYKKYQIELSTEVNGKRCAINPISFSWVSSDPAICSVEDGILTGHKDGEVTLTGTYGETTKTLKVAVQIPTANEMPVFHKGFPADGWALKQAGGKGLKIAELEDGFKLNYTGTGSARGAYISVARAEGAMTVWGLPQQIKMTVNPGDAPVKKITMSTTNGLGVTNQAWELTTEELPKNTETTIVANLSDWCDADFIPVFPIHINSIRFTMGASKSKTEFNINVPSFEAIYPQFSGVEANLADENGVKVYPNPVEAGESFVVAAEGTATVNVYTLNGAKVLTQEIDGQAVISTENMTSGIYFVNVATENTSATTKLVVK